MRDGQVNPIVEIVREILLRADSRLSEYELIKRIGNSTTDALFGQQLTDKLALFQCHFVVMNALYQLEGQFYTEGYFLNISAVEIYLQKIARQSEGVAVSKPTDEKLRSYYLDWHNLKQTTGNDVDEFLSSFWRCYLNKNRRIEALRQLGLPVDASWRAIKTQYRRLVALYHPDKGGSSSDFTRIRQAYEILYTHHE